MKSRGSAGASTFCVSPIRIEKELYERIEIIQNDIFSALPDYITLRDKYLNKMHDQQTQNEYIAKVGILSTKIVEYYILEAKLSAIEGRSQRLFKLPLPPTAPTGMHLVTENEKTYIKSEPYQGDLLLIKIQEDLKHFYKQTPVKQ